MTETPTPTRMTKDGLADARKWFLAGRIAYGPEVLSHIDFLADRVKELEAWGWHVKEILESPASVSVYSIAATHGAEYAGEVVSWEILGPPPEGRGDG